MSFAKSNDTANYKPHVPISTIKSEYPNSKIMVAIGGWGDTKGFSKAVESEAGIAQFAKDVKTMVDTNGVDGVGEFALTSQPSIQVTDLIKTSIGSILAATAPTT
jgi:hypothetical protein